MGRMLVIKNWARQMQQGIHFSMELQQCLESPNSISRQVCKLEKAKNTRQIETDS